MRASRGLKWENKMYKPKRSIDRFVAEIILAAIAQIYARSERASGNGVIIFQDSADISVAQPGLGRCYLVLSRRRGRYLSNPYIFPAARR